MSDLAASGASALGEITDIREVQDAVAPAGQVTAGTLLRLAREASGLHIAALAVSLKVPVKKLEALEADRFDLLPDAVFVRALASSVCRTLKIDAGPVLQLLPQTSSPKLIYQGVGINTPFRAPSDGPGPSMWSQVSRTAVLAGVLLLLAALVIILMPALKAGLGSGTPGTDSKVSNGASAGETMAIADVRANESPKMRDTAQDSAPVEDARVSSSPAFQAPAVIPAAPSTPLAGAVPAPSLLSLSSVPPVRPLATSSSPMSVAATGAASAPVIAGISSSGIVVFTAKSESWVEVTDSKGQVVLRRILAAGEVVGASGALPLSAIVGRANATHVQIRGKVFDLGAVAKDNVARFEVK